jgi:hypothetical protein
MEEELDKQNMESLQSQKDSNTRNKLVLTALVISAFYSAFWYLIAKYSESTEDFEMGGFLKGFGYLVDLTMSAVPVLLALSLKESKWKVFAIVLGIIGSVIRLYWFAKAMVPVPEEEFIYFEF